MHERDGVKLAIARAVALAGGPTGLARMIKRGVKRQNVAYWVGAGIVPAEHCPTIERETGVPCEELCPGVEWHVLRDGASSRDKDQGYRSHTPIDPQLAPERHGAN